MNNVIQLIKKLEVAQQTRKEAIEFLKENSKCCDDRILHKLCFVGDITTHKLLDIMQRADLNNSKPPLEKLLNPKRIKFTWSKKNV